ncbi:TIGR03085 family metal-binding protein [Cellulomonas sp. PhB150]|uniref:TIGR03085 family metal-binding protein n=1 Tax=Cellulomonas sp. PhB150 TaxID=2485188 RepID=UPI000F474AE0|nr:TIGR03085 family metal-binding protein [Cellulomonas sp. PhB150]ROS30481.1 uncharacterized protein (TIGR03085 family) [Cellulomonas sp. PhB150]
MTWHQILRARLTDVLLEVPPDAPTLCEGWEARHLAAHVVLRESSLVVGAGLVVPGMSSRADSAIDTLADTARTEGAYRDLVARVGEDPARWHPMSWAGEAANVVEFFVHAEDVRRGSGPVPPPEVEPELVEALWRQTVRASGLSLRRAPVGVVLVRDDGIRHQARKPRGAHGTVVVRGAVPEIVLWALGRGPAADVRLEGDPADVALLSARLPVA